MSGAEFIAVAGVISSIIAIVQGINQVVEAAIDAEGLPKVFRRASHKLPIISEILEATKSTFEKNKALQVEKTIKQTIDNCEENWQILKGLFDKVLPEDETTQIDRYYKAVKTLGKKGKVENLMKEMLENVQLLTNFKIMTATRTEEAKNTNVDKEKVAKAITDVTGWESSVPDNIFENGTYSVTVSGDGNLVATGENAKLNHAKDHGRVIDLVGNYYENGMKSNSIV